MTGFTLVRRNLFERPGRTSLLIFSTTIAFLIFGLLNGFLSLAGSFDSPTAQSRLMVVNRTGILRGLPVTYADQIRQVDGVRAATPVRLFGGYLKDRQDSVPLMMVEAPSYLAVNPTVTLSAAERQAFMASRDGLIVDEVTAAERGWSVGDQVTIRSLLFRDQQGRDAWTFVIAGTFPSQTEEGPQTGLLGHFAYLDEGLSVGRGLVNWFTVVTANPGVSDSVARRIDERFANSASESRTQSEIALAQAFLGQLGDLSMIVTLVVGAAFLALIFAVGNSIALTIRQRSRQIGVMKVLGFTPARVLRMTLAETMLLAGTGAAIGLGLASLLLTLVLTGMRMPVPSFGLPAITLVQGIGLALVLGLGTGLLPALRAMRVSPATAFGRE